MQNQESLSSIQYLLPIHLSREGSLVGAIWELGVDFRDQVGGVRALCVDFRALAGGIRELDADFVALVGGIRELGADFRALVGSIVDLGGGDKRLVGIVRALETDASGDLQRRRYERVNSGKAPP